MDGVAHRRRLAMPLLEQLTHAGGIGGDVLESPARRLDNLLDEDLDVARSDAIANTWIDFDGDDEIQRHDRRTQRRGQMKRSLVERPDVARGDSAAFRAEVHRLSGAPQPFACLVEDAAPVF